MFAILSESGRIDFTVVATPAWTAFSASYSGALGKQARDARLSDFSSYLIIKTPGCATPMLGILKRLATTVQPPPPFGDCFLRRFRTVTTEGVARRDAVVAGLDATGLLSRAVYSSRRLYSAAQKAKKQCTT